MMHVEVSLPYNTRCSCQRPNKVYVLACGDGNSEKVRSNGLNSPSLRGLCFIPGAAKLYMIEIAVRRPIVSLACARVCRASRPISSLPYRRSRPSAMENEKRTKRILELILPSIHLHKQTNWRPFVLGVTGLQGS